MNSLDLIKQTAYQQGFEKQAMSLLAKALGQSSKASKNLWSLFKGKPNPLFEPVFKPGAKLISPKFTPRELERLKVLQAPKVPVIRPEFTPRELEKLEKYFLATKNPQAVARRARDFSSSGNSILGPAGFTMGGPKIL